MPGSTKLKTLKSTHPQLDLSYVEMLRALYKGGKELLQNDRVMRRVFPQHERENATSYKLRCSRAFYDNDFALVINKITAGLAQDPVVFDDDGAAAGRPTAKQIPPYWAELAKDARPPGDVGAVRSFDEVIRQVVTEGLVCRFGWVLCDLPEPERDEDGKPLATSALDQEVAGAGRAYPVPYRADTVLNWYEKAGTLRWVRTYSSDMPAEQPEDDREWTVHTWKVWTAVDITTYELVVNAEGKDPTGREWKDDDLVPPAGPPVPHTFGVVPWVLFDTSAPDEPTMWVGDLIESRCRSQFNESCGETHQRLAYMFQQLYEFLGSEVSGPDREISENQEDPNRAGRDLAQRGPNVVQVRGQDDDARFIAPDMSGSAVNRQALAEGREAIPRVTGQLALSTDTSGAMIRRSGESKAQDKIAEEVVMGAVGKRALAMANAVRDMLARGRGEAPEKVPACKGYENFTADDSGARVEEAVALSTAPIKSATLQIEHSMLVARAILGDAATPEIMAKIREDLEGTITQESVNQANMPPVPAGHQLDEDGTPIPLPPQRDEPAGKKPPAGKKK